SIEALLGGMRERWGQLSQWMTNAAGIRQDLQDLAQDLRVRSDLDQSDERMEDLDWQGLNPRRVFRCERVRSTDLESRVQNLDCDLLSAFSPPHLEPTSAATQAIPNDLLDPEPLFPRVGLPLCS